jgi:translation initiation factor 2B subunit (eIF-2B alpha/beta/delta family)/8-oxo-dGTP pyrophosphatase MutT (NUDIX family)
MVGGSYDLALISSRHHIAPISGTIETTDPSPVAAAWREITEETTLTPASLTLLRQGKSYTFRDESVRREWTVFPFLFRLKSPADEQRIQIDWEHEGWGWHSPDAVIRDADKPTLKGVPRLAESLRRVWFETDLGSDAGEALADGLDALAHDHESGARQLAGAALHTLRGVIAALDAPDDRPTDEWWVKVRLAAWHLWKNGRESMGAAIMSALLGALAGIEQTMQKCQELGSWRSAVLTELDVSIAARQKSAQRISQAFGAHLERTFQSNQASQEPISILTLSESSTIRQGLRHAALESGFVLDLRILESRPLYEGVSLAGSVVEDLASASTSSAHKITLYSDASAALAASGVDIVVVGADRIAASGAVSNKTGSLPAVLSAKHVCNTARVVVLGESDKVAPPGRPEDHVVEDNDPKQISRAWQDEYNSTRVRNAAAALEGASVPGLTVEIRNVFFEWLPASLIDVYVTECGEWTVHSIAQHSEKLEAEEKRLFGSL